MDLGVLVSVGDATGVTGGSFATDPFSFFTESSFLYSRTVTQMSDPTKRTQNKKIGTISLVWSERAWFGLRAIAAVWCRSVNRMRKSNKANAVRFILPESVLSSDLNPDFITLIAPFIEWVKMKLAAAKSSKLRITVTLAFITNCSVRTFTFPNSSASASAVST